MPEQQPDEVQVAPSSVRQRVERDRAQRKERQSRSVPPPAHPRPQAVTPIQPVAVVAPPAQAGANPSATPPPAIPVQPAPVPAGSFMAAIVDVAPNPFNTRDVGARPEMIQELARSMKKLGQLAVSPVVDRAAFLAIFPADQYPKEAKAVGTARFVQVNGGRRRAAALLANRELEVSVKNDLAATREIFIEATLAENVDREELDPIEQARAIELMVDEAGGNKTAVARRRRRSDTWVKQQLDLLKLEPEVQAALRVDEVDPLDDSPAAKGRPPRLPARTVRNWHNDPRDMQLANLAKWRRRHDPTFVGDSDPQGGAAGLEPEPKVTRIRRLILRLGETEAQRARAVRAELSDEERLIWVEELQRD